MRKTLEQFQPHLLTQFEHVLATSQLSHAYLFVGEFASLEMALYLAQSRFCESLSSLGLPCQKCRPCRLISEEEFSDVTLIQPTGQNIRTEQIRQLTTDFARSGYESNRQVFIIKEAEKMHPNAANTLLKQIEEPSGDYQVFLLTADLDKILPTIRSRCQVFNFLTDKNWVEHQLEVAGLLKSQAKVLKHLVKRPKDIEELIANKKVLDFVQHGQKFLEQFKTSPDKAYLLLPHLVSLASEKYEQDLLLQLLTLQAGEGPMEEVDLFILDKLHLARRMWQANVSLQNCLDYCFLSE